MHQTIEEIHRRVLDGQLLSLGERAIRAQFERTYQLLCLTDARPISAAAKEAAFEQVMSYFWQNQDEMRRMVDAEVPVSLEKGSYILLGKVDLLLAADGTLELLDFKTSRRPVRAPELAAAYERQLCTYAHILERRLGRHPGCLLLYWTGEPRKEGGGSGQVPPPRSLRGSRARERSAGAHAACARGR